MIKIIFKKPATKNEADTSQVSESTGNGTILVRHLEGSGEKYPPQNYGYEAWQDFWEEKTGMQFPTTGHKCPCHENNENNPPIKEFVGAHVIDKDGKMYITPTCDSCNKKAIKDEVFRDKLFDVKKIDLVPFCPDELKKDHQKQ